MLHVQLALSIHILVSSSAKQQREITTVAVLMKTSANNSKSLISTELLTSPRLKRASHTPHNFNKMGFSYSTHNCANVAP